ncbi:hypothetical protein O181_061646 [Austropuccinia psidii MF-1]|uniref:Chromo domain-containing protein n=1 Tax=Austropuccinia psidii MF-1 TaxID=1389203 RepID=A0A9Q3EN77_9BASI|nr:hypothetical protein [Austropuccinia psidii MF-1]
MVEKGRNPLFTVDHLKKNLLSIHPKSKDFHDMCKRACDTAAKCIDEAKEYNKPRYEKTQMEPDFKEGDQVIVSTLNFSNIEGPKKKKDSFLGPFTIIKLIGRNAVETGEDMLPSRNKTQTPKDMVEVEDFHDPVKKIIKARKIRPNGNDQREYLVRFKNQISDKNKWLAEDAIPDGKLHLRRFRASGRAEQYHQ